MRNTGGLNWAEVCIARDGPEFVRLLERVADVALAHAIVLDANGETVAADEHRALVEAACVILDRRRRVAGLSMSSDELRD